MRSSDGKNVLRGLAWLVCALVAIVPSAVKAQVFSIRDAGDICQIEGHTGEEATLLRMYKESVPQNLLEVYGVFTLCETKQRIIAGETDQYYPLISLVALKTEGKVLPFATIRNDNLAEHVQRDMGIRNYSQEQARASQIFRQVVEERGQTQEITLSSTPPVLIDKTDRTASVAQVSTVNVGDNETRIVTVSTTILVDNYVVRIDGADVVSTTKAFWRLQALTERLARNVVLVQASQFDGGRAIFYEERTSVEQGSVKEGTVVWSLVQESPGGDLPAEPAIRGEVTIPDMDMQSRLTIRPNGDPTLPASHIVEIIFLTPENFDGEAIDNVLRIAFKATEQSAGDPLVGIPAKVADGFFLLALNDGAAEVQANTTRMRRQSWIDIPVVYRSGRRALLTLQKGVRGNGLFEEALHIWERGTQRRAIKWQDRILPSHRAGSAGSLPLNPPIPIQRAPL